jgi:tetratricopeptide (TPR) repeat protein
MLLKKISALVLFYALSVGATAQESRIVRGNVTDGTNPLPDVRIALSGKQGAGTYTDSEGNYEITAEAGDLLEYTYTGMKDYLVRVEEVTRYLNLVMVPDIEELDEVTVTRSRRKSQQDLALEYATSPRILKTAFGYLDADTAPAQVIMIDQERILPVAICILDVIRNQFPGVRTTGNCQEGGDVIFRGAGSIGSQRVGIYDVDGLVFQQAPLWIDVSQIKRMALISSIAYTARYGAVGGGGVVVINTISGNPQFDRALDPMRLRNNYVKEPALGSRAVASSEPTYLSALREAGTSEEARTVYSRYAPQYRPSPYFYLDAYRHFYAVRGETEFADQLIRANKRAFEGNAPLLKALAHTYQEQGRYAEALEVLKEVFILRPNYSQSYQDLAGAYRDAGAYEKAAAMYARYKYLVDENFLLPSEDFSKIIQHESDNLLQLHGSKIGANSRKIISDPFVQNTTRIVVEWNETEAEFELQFVNPEGQYHIWKHTFAENEDRIIDEKMTGYAMEEYIVDSSLPGLWEINVRYNGNKSLTPTFLKVTTYFNYGERDQTRQVRTFRLTLKDNWQQLMSVNNPGVSRIR